MAIVVACKMTKSRVSKTRLKCKISVDSIPVRFGIFYSQWEFKGFDCGEHARDRIGHRRLQRSQAPENAIGYLSKLRQMSGLCIKRVWGDILKFSLALFTVAP